MALGGGSSCLRVGYKGRSDGWSSFSFCVAGAARQIGAAGQHSVGVATAARGAVYLIL